MPKPLALSLPPSLTGQRDWLTEQEERLARLTVRALRKIVTDAYQAYTATLTAAAGDLTALDAISTSWTRWVQQQFGDELMGLHLHGAYSAWLSAGQRVTEATTAAWLPVVNDAAVAYQATAVNRLANVGETVWRHVRTLATNGLQQGLPTEAIKRQIEDVTRFSEFRADTIARTETVGAYVAGDMDSARALGDAGPVEKVWVAALDERTRESHADLHDTCIPLDEMFDVGGYPADRPFDSSLPAGEVVNCRCIVEFLYPGDTRPDGTVIPDGADTDLADTA